MPTPSTVVFDIGNVVLEWDPIPALAGTLNAEEIQTFFDEVDFATWNREQDRGRSWEDAEAELVSRFPHREAAIRAYRMNFADTILGEVAGVRELLTDLSAASVRLLALTNFASDTFWATRTRFDILDRFDDIIVSGDEGLIKPEVAIYQVLLSRHGLRANDVAFVDDTAANVDAAGALGMQAIQFRDSAQLRRDLGALGLPV